LKIMKVYLNLFIDPTNVLIAKIMFWKNFFTIPYLKTLKAFCFICMFLIEVAFYLGYEIKLKL
jgi:hypothetical protein